MISSLFISPEAGRTVLFVAVIVVVGWFAAGMFVNVRKGNRIARWLQDGLPLFGEKTTLRWLGTAGVELKIQNPHKPLLSVEVFILLEPRDIPLLWGYFHARGRRDVLIVRCLSSSIPRFQFEAADPRAWSTRGTQIETARRQWTSVAPPHGLNVIAHGEGRLEAAGEVLALAAGTHLPLVRVAVRQAGPQLELQWQLFRYERVSSRRLFETVLQINTCLTGRP